MDAQDAHRGAQKTACCMCFDISDALSQGRRRHVKPYCDRKCKDEKKKVQADDFNKEDHVHRILGDNVFSW